MGASAGLGLAGGACGWIPGRAGSWVFYLLPFGIGDSSPHIPGHPTSMCDLGVKYRFDCSWSRKGNKRVLWQITQSNPVMNSVMILSLYLLEH